MPALGLDKAAQVFYDGFTSLPEYANFCDARNATVAVAGGRRPASRRPCGRPGTRSASTTAARRAPRPRRRASARAERRPLPFESPHPYGNNGDCTWTYNNGTAGFTFHFTLLDTEKDYDYVYVKDAAGNVLATYTGTKRTGGFYGPCIPTSTGSVQLASDPGVTAQGFTVDAVKPC